MMSRTTLRELIASAEFARAYTLTVVTVAFSSFAIERISSEVTYLTMLTLLAVIGAAVLFARREELSWLRLAPSSLLVFLLIALASVVWSMDRVSTVRGWIALVAFAFLAVTVGHVRDTLQTVRAIGDVLRMLLTLSLGLEIVSGILLDVPIAFLGIEGDIAYGGPIQGIFGASSMLGFVAIVGLITFAIEWYTRSIPPGLAVASTVLGIVLAMLAASPVVYTLALCVAVAAAALATIRRVPQERRSGAQWLLAAVVVAWSLALFFFRRPVLALMGTGTDFERRGELWRHVLGYVDARPILGWGWTGEWVPGQFPSLSMSIFMGETQRSAMNAYLDLLLQLGAVGMMSFVALGGIALVRAWLVASARHSVIYAWTPLVLVTLAMESIVESFALVGAGWFLLVLCALRAGQSHSWRENIDAAHTGTIPTVHPQG